MTDIEQEARAEAERQVESGALYTDDAQSGYTKGYIAGASRPASPATREAVAALLFYADGRDDWGVSNETEREWYLDIADNLMAAFDIRERSE